MRQYERQLQLLHEGRLVEASQITTGIGAAVSAIPSILSVARFTVTASVMIAISY